MSIIIHGNNSFDSVPYVPIEQSQWPEVVASCDPLLRSVALLGLSALYKGISDSEGSVKEVALARVSFDEWGRLDGQLRFRPFTPETERAHNTAIAGAAIVGVAVSLSRVLQASPYSFKDKDYTTPLGPIMRRELTIPVSYGQQHIVGGYLNAAQATALKARVFSSPNASYPDNVSLTLANVQGDDRGSSSALIVTRDKADRVSSQIIDTERQGDFCFVSDSIGFETLTGYARAFGHMAIHSRRPC